MDSVDANDPCCRNDSDGKRKDPIQNYAETRWLQVLSFYSSVAQFEDHAEILMEHRISEKSDGAPWDSIHEKRKASLHTLFLRPNLFRIEWSEKSERPGKDQEQPPEVAPDRRFIMSSNGIRIASCYSREPHHEEIRPCSEDVSPGLQGITGGCANLTLSILMPESMKGGCAPKLRSPQFLGKETLGDCVCDLLSLESRNEECTVWIDEAAPLIRKWHTTRIGFPRDSRADMKYHIDQINQMMTIPDLDPTTREMLECMVPEFDENDKSGGWRGFAITTTMNCRPTTDFQVDRSAFDLVLPSEEKNNRMS